ncbi:4Fe-4S single cluster domain-containing protein [Leptothoe sp. ISB3NOV94-8A]|uniref:Anaerobic ribonucleoside-triphosphate reductase-activating protein n=1 Tax=Adonisia turfae CCMR0081 TaxID=2292702 RepID=A0A6M0RTD9_9CYAN|nr:4Fe-4S single cluster domain-containing protein [Adonisia turfae]MDV3347216.1 4Fe-4S single cluster domain-containing protein [Leptothoe sp. LEGE 181152]NEZ59022.1 radical SAM protein [Adonisia turfae CCMR0081]
MPLAEKDTTIPPNHLNIMGYVNRSEVNGPGRRAVVWVQGCLRECPGCFNPASWSFEPNQIVSIDELVSRILNDPENEGVTFSGGEPFWQATALAEVARQVKKHGLNVMSFSGFTLDELQKTDAPEGSQALLKQLDILIDGPYVESLAINEPTSPVSSRNQQVRIFNPDLANRITWASDQIEVHVFKDGSRLVTGYQGYSYE